MTCQEGGQKKEIRSESRDEWEGEQTVCGNLRSQNKLTATKLSSKPSVEGQVLPCLLHLCGEQLRCPHCDLNGPHAFAKHQFSHLLTQRPSPAPLPTSICSQRATGQYRLMWMNPNLSGKRNTEGQQPTRWCR